MERKGFLRLVAEDICNLFQGDYSDITVVFPNKRASLFLNQELKRLGGDKPMWTPQYVTISDIFEQLSSVTVADPIYLVCQLHQVYQRQMGIDESLDRFYSWGELLLNDFDDVDNNLVDAKTLFTNVSDLDDLTRFDYMTDEQIEAVRQFFCHFDPERKTLLKEKFQSVWQHLYPIYQTFRQTLLSARKAYRGMQKRQVIESVTQHPEAAAPLLTSAHYIVVGFNVLSETEKRLFKFLKAERDTLFYWDYDRAYIDHEAGAFIRSNLQLFPNRFQGRDYYDNFTTDTEKQITIISSPTEDAQCRYLSQWLQRADITLDNRTAIVLCNEKILNSVLHSIPSTLDGQIVQLNVTMGFPLTDTPLYSFLCTLLDLQTHGRTQTDKWRYAQVAAVLRHPYTAWLSNGDAASLLATLNRQSILFPADELFRSNVALDELFTPCTTPQDLTQYFIHVINRLRTLQTNSPLFAESIYNAYTLVSRLGILQETLPAFQVNKDTYSRLLRQLLRNKAVPFHGEPAVGLQVMGLLETRNLDFDNLIMLSVNEGQMPRISMNNTFIPYTLRNLHGMTTIEKQTSLYAYYFYRLLGRAKNITLMYNNYTEGINQGEMSRFLMQLQIEARQLFPSTVEIQLKTLVADMDVDVEQELEIQNNPVVLDKLLHRFSLVHEAEYSEKHHGAKMTLSPSAINDYLDCRRRFFLKYVVGLKAEEELTDDVDDAMFGTLLHYCMEHIYRPCMGRQVQSSYLLSMARDDEKLSQLVDEAFAVNVFKAPGGIYNGHQLLNKHVLITYIKMQLQFDAQTCPFTLLGVESPTYAAFSVPTDGGPVPVRIGGVIDRYERTADGSIRIVDYKTSSRPQTASNLTALFNPEQKNRSHHVLQALYYCDVMTETETQPVFPQLMYVKLPPAKRSLAVQLGKEQISDFRQQLKTEYHEKLLSVIQEIFHPQTVFSMTETMDACKFCDFKTICGR
ncbi:MAG: PD-(D/E)XK nuclease family protein [Bacteroidaceae bacterium]|nr:PD-(D/E)XK nuclease family protein [Bacteroidaceae bacterium]